MNPLRLIIAIALTTAQTPGQPAAPGVSLRTSPAPTNGVVTVTVKPASDVAGAQFTVGEIAEVTGDDKLLVEKIQKIECGASPLAGLSRSIAAADILARLRMNLIDPKRVSIVCAAGIKISRAGSEVPQDEVMKTATAALLEARKDKADGAVIEPSPLIGHWVVGPGKREIQAGAIRGSLDGGQVTVPVTILVEGRPAKSIDVVFKIKRVLTVLVAKRQLEAHTIVKAEDISTTTVEAVPSGGTPIPDEQTAIGKRTTRQILIGAVLTEGLLESAPVIKAGGNVTIEIAVGGVTISSDGIARSPGAPGETIRVFATKTQKDITATVIDAKTVRLEEKP